MITAERLDPAPVSGDYRYKLSNGKYLQLSLMDVELYGEYNLLGARGITLSRERLPAMRYGATLGTLPRNFDWRTERPTSPFVDVRRGDFVLRHGESGDYWEVARSLTSRDLDCIPSFRRL